MLLLGMLFLIWLDRAATRGSIQLRGCIEWPTGSSLFPGLNKHALILYGMAPVLPLLVLSSKLNCLELNHGYYIT